MTFHYLMTLLLLVGLVGLVLHYDYDEDDDDNDEDDEHPSHTPVGGFSYRFASRLTIECTQRLFAQIDKRLTSVRLLNCDAGKS